MKKNFTLIVFILFNVLLSTIHCQDIVADSTTFAEIKNRSSDSLQTVSINNWGFGYSMLFGYEYFTNDLKTNFNNHAIIGMSVDFEYKQTISFNLGFNHGAHRTKADIDIESGIWNKNSKAETNTYEVLMGPIIINSKRLKVIPFTGFAYLTISDRKPSPYTFELNPDFSKTYPDYSPLFRLDKITWALGFSLNLKEKWLHTNDYDHKGRKIKHEVYYKLKYTYYMPNFDSNYTNYKGNIHSLSIGMGGIMRRVKSVKQ
jgi:hypothetical protein